MWALLGWIITVRNIYLFIYLSTHWNRKLLKGHKILSTCSQITANLVKVFKRDMNLIKILFSWTLEWVCWDADKGLIHVNAIITIIRVINYFSPEGPCGDEVHKLNWFGCEIRKETSFQRVHRENLRRDFYCAQQNTHCSVDLSACKPVTLPK